MNTRSSHHQRSQAGFGSARGQQERLEQRLVVISNRLPVRYQPASATSKATWKPSPGGLVSALRPLMSAACRPTTAEQDPAPKGAWIGWPGDQAPQDLPAQFECDGTQLFPLAISSEELEGFYAGLSNSALWPLYHDRIREPQFQSSWWKDYEQVNRRYAQTAAKALDPNSVAWVHDYQLHLVPKLLRELAPRTPIGFFNHIPFPAPDLFAQLPWRRELLEGLLGADLVGFQTQADAEHFRQAAVRFTNCRRVGERLLFEGRTILAKAFPISIDTDDVATKASSQSVQAAAVELRRQLGASRVLMGVDRLDYTKGIDLRLAAYERLLERLGPKARDITFVQVAVPTRESVAAYGEMRGAIEQAVGRINGRFGTPDWTPVHYRYDNLPQEELLSYYAAADVLAVTPVKDGMNLVAKEFIAARADLSHKPGILVLSEFAGAACELRQALLVQPHDIEGTSRSLEQALQMQLGEARRRMEGLRSVVQRFDVHHWSRSFLHALQQCAPQTPNQQPSKTIGAGA